VNGSPDASRVLFTLSIMTGVVMLAAGLLSLGSVLRFVSNAVMVGFINAVSSGSEKGAMSRRGTFGRRSVRKPAAAATSSTAHQLPKAFKPRT
jgi:hypothetical protein